jgi:hypothetical protein
MDILALRKIVSDACVVTDNDMTIPKFATQFTFSESKRQVLIRIPAYEDALSGSLFGLIFHIIKTAIPHVKLKKEELRQRLMAALEGKAIPGDELDIRGIIQNTGSVAHAIIESRILITAKAN